MNKQDELLLIQLFEPDVNVALAQMNLILEPEVTDFLQNLILQYKKE